MGEREDIFDDNLRSLMEDAEERVPKRVWSGLSERLAAEGLQKAKPVVIIPLWARWSAVGVAVAAAIVLWVFLFVRGGESSIEDALIAEVAETETPTSNIESINGIVQSDGDVAQSEDIDSEGVSTVSENNVGTSVADAAGVLASNETADETSGEASEVSLAEQIAESPKYIAEATDVVNAAEMADATDAADVANATDVANAAEIADVAETDVADATDAAETGKPWTDPFAETARSHSSNKTRTALTVSGNAFGNASSGSSSSSTGIRRQMSSSIDGQPAEGIAEKSDSNYGIPATFGVGVKIIFTPRWSLGVGVNYSLLSRTFSGEYTSYNASGELTTNSYSNIRHRVDYIGIPVNAYFSIIQSHAVDFYAYAGGTIEKAVSSRYILDHGIPSYKESVKGVQCSTDIGIGVEFIAVDWLGIYIDPSLRYYFPNSHQPKSIRTQESLNFGFEIGLRFRL